MLTLTRSKPAEKRYALYTGNVPASWTVLWNGQPRGEIRGYCPQYSREARFILIVDGSRVDDFSRLRHAKAAASVIFQLKEQACPSTHSATLA